jgi:hypothetical protein
MYDLSGGIKEKDGKHTYMHNKIRKRSKTYLKRFLERSCASRADGVGTQAQTLQRLVLAAKQLKKRVPQ